MAEQSAEAVGGFLEEKVEAHFQSLSSWRSKHVSVAFFKHSKVKKSTLHGKILLRKVQVLRKVQISKVDKIYQRFWERWLLSKHVQVSVAFFKHSTWSEVKMHTLWQDSPQKKQKELLIKPVLFPNFFFFYSWQTCIYKYKYCKRRAFIEKNISHFHDFRRFLVLVLQDFSQHFPSQPNPRVILLLICSVHVHVIKSCGIQSMNISKLQKLNSNPARSVNSSAPDSLTGKSDLILRSTRKSRVSDDTKPETRNPICESLNE